MNAAAAYYIYILASGHHGTLYIGVCNDLGNRLERCIAPDEVRRFVKKYRVTAASFTWKTYASPRDAIEREKQLKNLASAIGRSS